VATTTFEAGAGIPEAARVVRTKHHVLVRISHWLNIPFLLGLTVSGLSIYWAAPVYHHAPTPFTYMDPQSQQPVNDTTTDYLGSIGLWIVRHVPGQRHYTPPADWLYNHISLGTGDLAPALRLHWLFAYLFMANGLLYLVGLGLGGGYKALLPRRGDLQNAVRMQIYYIGLPIAKVLRRRWEHPHVTTKYNALQRAAYFSVPIMGLLSVLTGWAMHKPSQLGWLAALFGGYDYARVWHFWLMWLFVLFVIPHVILVFADGWDTFRSMVVGWTNRIPSSGLAPPKD
jgi:thiosulfate reductase cytochrome b subunit